MNNKTTFIIFILFIFTLSACGSNVPIQPTSTSIPTETSIPTIAPTATEIPPTATSTAIPIPDYMSDLVERFGLQQFTNEMHLVIDESSPEYPSELWGIQYKNLIILSWLPAQYVNEKGEFVSGAVLARVCQKVGNEWMLYSLSSFEPAGKSSCPTVAWAISNTSQLIDSTKGEYPIVKASTEWKTKGVFDAAFPDGSDKPITIPGIGTVFPVKHIEYIDGGN